MHVNVIVDSFVFLLPQSLLAKLCSSFFGIVLTVNVYYIGYWRVTGQRMDVKL